MQATKADSSCWNVPNGAACLQGSRRGRDAGRGAGDSKGHGLALLKTDRQGPEG